MILRELFPFAGYRQRSISIRRARELRLRNAKLVDGRMDRVWAEFFEVEWLGYRWVLWVRRPAMVMRRFRL